MKRGILHPLVFCVVVSLIVLAGAVRAQIVDDVELRRVFKEANELYEAGEYAAAIERYGALAEAGVDDAALHYNTANAYYKINDLGRAVLNYERALRLEPRDRAARENLSLAETQLRDKQFVARQNRFWRAFGFLHSNLSATEIFIVSSLSFVALCLMGVLFVFRDTAVVTKLYGWVSFLSLGRLVGLSRSQDLAVALGLVAFFFATTALSARIKIDAEAKRERAVIVAKEIAVFASPTSDATLEFRVHEGTRVIAEKSRSNWVKIRLPGGLDGWVDSAAIERI